MKGASSNSARCASAGCRRKCGSKTNNARLAGGRKRRMRPVTALILAQITGQRLDKRGVRMCDWWREGEFFKPGASWEESKKLDTDLHGFTRIQNIQQN